MVFAIRPLRAIFGAGFVGKTPRHGEEGGNLFRVIANLQAVIINDDWPLQDGRIGQDEADEFGDAKFLEIDISFLKHFRARRNDIFGTVFAFDDRFENVVISQLVRKDIDCPIGNMVLVEPFFDFPTRTAAWGHEDFEHG